MKRDRLSHKLNVKKRTASYIAAGKLHVEWYRQNGAGR